MLQIPDCALPPSLYHATLQSVCFRPSRRQYVEVWDPAAGPRLVTRGDALFPTPWEETVKAIFGFVKGALKA